MVEIWVADATIGNHFICVNLIFICGNNPALLRAFAMNG